MVALDGVVLFCAACAVDHRHRHGAAGGAGVCFDAACVLFAADAGGLAGLAHMWLYSTYFLLEQLLNL